MNVQQLHYAPLLNQLHQRAVRSVVSQLALRSKSLSQYLESQYFQPPGQGDHCLQIRYLKARLAGCLRMKKWRICVTN